MMGNGQALKKQKEQEEKLEIEKTKRAKDQDKIHRDRIKAKLEQVSFLFLSCMPATTYPLLQAHAVSVLVRGLSGILSHRIVWKG